MKTCSTKPSSYGHLIWVTIDEVYKATRKARKARTEEDRRLALPLDLTTTTVTSLTKAIDRINRGEAGTCPVVAVGISGATWDGTPYREV